MYIYIYVYMYMYIKSHIKNVLCCINLKTHLLIFRFPQIFQYLTKCYIQCVKRIVEEFHKVLKYLWKPKNGFFNLVYITFCF